MKKNRLFDAIVSREKVATKIDHLTYPEDTETFEKLAQEHSIYLKKQENLSCDLYYLKMARAQIVSDTKKIEQKIVESANRNSELTEQLIFEQERVVKINIDYRNKKNELQNLTFSHQNKLKESESLKEKLGRIETDIETLLNMIATKHDEVRRQSSQIEYYKELEYVKREQFLRLKTDFDLEVTRSIGLTEEISDAKSKTTQLEENIQLLVQENLQKSEEVRQKILAITNTKDRLCLLNNDYLSLSTRIKKLDKENRVRGYLLDKLKRKSHKLDHKLQMAQDELSRLIGKQSELNRSIARNQKELKGHNARFKLLNTKLHEQEVATHLLERDLGRISSDNKIISRKNIALDVAYKRGQIDVAKKSVRLEKKVNELKKVKEEEIKAYTQLQSTQKQVEKFKIELSNLRSSLLVKSQSLKALCRQNNQTLETVEAYRVEMRAIKDEISSQDTQLLSKMKQKEKLSQEIIELQKKINILTSILDLTIKEVNSIEITRNNLSQQKIGLDATIEDLQHQIASHSNKLRIVTDETQKTSETIATQEKLQAELKTKLTELSNNRKSIESNLAHAKKIIVVNDDEIDLQRQCILNIEQEMRNLSVLEKNLERKGNSRQVTLKRTHNAVIKKGLRLDHLSNKVKKQTIDLAELENKKMAMIEEQERLEILLNTTKRELEIVEINIHKKNENLDSISQENILLLNSIKQMAETVKKRELLLKEIDLQITNESASTTVAGKELQRAKRAAQVLEDQLQRASQHLELLKKGRSLQTTESFQIAELKKRKQELLREIVVLLSSESDEQLMDNLFTDLEAKDADGSSPEGELDSTLEANTKRQNSCCVG